MMDHGMGRRDPLVWMGPDGDRVLTLVRQKLTLMYGLDPDLVDEISSSELNPMLAHNIVLRIRGHVFGEQLPPHSETRTVHIPDGWREHWRWDHRDRWWMRSWVRRCPIRLREVTITANMAAYPWLSLRTQNIPHDFGQAVRLVLPPTSTLSGEGLPYAQQFRQDR
jgi:hypothetical protein